MKRSLLQAYRLALIEPAFEVTHNMARSDHLFGVLVWDSKAEGVLNLHHEFNGVESHDCGWRCLTDRPLSCASEASVSSCG
jgi:hypothetical protein